MASNLFSYPLDTWSGGGGTFTGLTNTELRASPVPVSIAGVANAATDSGNPVKTGAVFRSIPTPYTDGQRADSTANAYGSLFIDNSGRTPTYTAGNSSFTVAAVFTDFFTITGSASKIIRIKKIGVSATSTAANDISLAIIKRSTANTGGTSTAITAVPHDSSDGSATATVLAYSTNPTLGTIVGIMETVKLTISTATTAGTYYVMDHTISNAKPITLRGITQVLSINGGGATAAGNNFTCYIEWTEE